MDTTLAYSTLSVATRDSPWSATLQPTNKCPHGGINARCTFAALCVMRPVRSLARRLQGPLHAEEDVRLRIPRELRHGRFWCATAGRRRLGFSVRMHIQSTRNMCGSELQKSRGVVSAAAAILFDRPSRMVQVQRAGNALQGKVERRAGRAQRYRTPDQGRDIRRLRSAAGHMQPNLLIAPFQGATPEHKAPHPGRHARGAFSNRVLAHQRYNGGQPTTIPSPVREGRTYNTTRTLASGHCVPLRRTWRRARSATPCPRFAASGARPPTASDCFRFLLFRVAWQDALVAP